VSRLEKELPPLQVPLVRPKPAESAGEGGPNCKKLLKIILI